MGTPAAREMPSFDVAREQFSKRPAHPRAASQLYWREVRLLQRLRFLAMTISREMRHGE